jgi:hypothetical protein
MSVPLLRAATARITLLARESGKIRGKCGALSTQEEQLLVDADGSILKCAVDIKDLVQTSKYSLDVWFETMTEKCQFYSVIEFKRSNELVKLHYVF